MDYIFGQNSCNVAEDKWEDYGTNSDNTYHVNASNIEALEKRFAYYDRYDNDNDETHFNPFLASHMRISYISCILSANQIDFRLDSED